MNAFATRIRALRQASEFLGDCSIFADKQFMYNAADNAFVLQCATQLILNGEKNMVKVFDKLCDRKTYENRYKGLGKFRFLRAAAWYGSGQAAYDLAVENGISSHFDKDITFGWNAIGAALDYLPAALFLYKHRVGSVKLLLKIETILHQAPEKYFQDEDAQQFAVNLVKKCCTYDFTMVLAAFLYKFGHQKQCFKLINGKFETQVREKNICAKGSVANWLFSLHCSCTLCASDAVLPKTYGILKEAVELHPEAFPSPARVVTALFVLGSRRVCDIVPKLLKEGVLLQWNCPQLRLAPVNGRRICGWCTKRLKRITGQPTPKKCGCCRSMYYCNATCQTKDWQRHRYECVASADDPMPANI